MSVLNTLAVYVAHSVKFLRNDLKEIGTMHFSRGSKSWVYTRVYYIRTNCLDAEKLEGQDAQFIANIFNT